MALHRWDLSPSEATQVQRELRERLSLNWDGRAVEYVGGVDVGFPGRGTARAAIVVLRFPELRPVASALAEAPASFPYVPGLLSFREAPAILAAWDALRETLPGGVRLPDVVILDGQGIAHPRGIGIAAHVGLWLERPTFGVAKSRLYGRHAEPGNAAGDRAPLCDEHDPQKIIGAVLRTRDNVKPVYVSPGHLVDVETSVRLTLACTGKYRLPEPTRWAHRVAGGESISPDKSRQLSLL